MAGLFTSGEQDMLGNIVQQRQQANQALGSGYGKYGGIVQAGAALTDVGADAMTGGKIGSADPRMQQLQGAKAIFTKVAQEMGEVNSAAFYEKLAQELAAQYPEQAQKAAAKAAEVKKEGLQTMLTQQQIASSLASTEATKASTAATTQKALDEKMMRQDLSTLGDNPSEQDIRNVLMKYGDADKIMADLARREAAAARKDAAVEAAKIRAEASKEAARIRADASKQAADARKDTREAERLRFMPKDVAEAIADTAVVVAQDKNLNDILVMLEGDKEKNIKPSVSFAIEDRAWSTLKSAVSIEDKNALAMAKVEKALNAEVNTILQMAKGVQTEGDAKRAREILASALETKTNAGYAQAIRDLKQVKQQVIGKNKAYVSTRGYGDYWDKNVKTTVSDDTGGWSATVVK